MSLELNVTELINRFADDGDLDPMDLSGSCMEHGQNAGQITWENCSELASENTELNQRIIKHAQEVRDHFRGYGAWDENEINGWTDQELIALTLQETTANYREYLDEIRLDIPEDQRSGRFFQCDIEDHENFGDWYLYLGS